ncbi:MAG: methyltransferase [Paracoccaceae bacterium]|nr:methyltransferase [Paracoccaceae bacterium]
MRAEPFSDAELSTDGFLGGRVQIRQPIKGYRAGVDPVLLAASIPAKPGQSVLELGCGGAPALCCLGARVAGLTLTGLELQPGYADLARINLALNGLFGEVVLGDVQAPPAGLRALRFDHVMANPPYYSATGRRGAQTADRELALAGETPLQDWVATAARRVVPGGTVTFIQRADRLPELLTAFASCLGSLECLPLSARAGRAPGLVLMRGRKEGKAPFRLHAALHMHANDAHLRDGDDYTQRFSAVFRDGQALNFPA